VRRRFLSVVITAYKVLQYSYNCSCELRVYVLFYWKKNLKVNLNNVNKYISEMLFIPKNVRYRF